MDLTKLRHRYLRVPPAVFEELESRHYVMPAGEAEDHDSWVTARFSPHQHQDHILYMGDDPGNIGVFDVSKFHDRSIPIEQRQLHFFPAHEGAVMDIVGVPHFDNKIVSISGDSTVRCWDLCHTAWNRKSELFYGHEGSVRSICFAPDDSNIFTTGGRDGRLKVWDMRVSQIKKKDIDCRLSTITYDSAHPSSQLERPPPGTPRSRKSHQQKYVPCSVTSVRYLDTFHIASASSNAESGIKVWDVRMAPRNGEGRAVRTLKVPTSKERKSFGVTCMSVDRFGSRLFASCTNSTIFEFAVLTSTDTPVHTYTGLKISDFYTQLACSPIADVIACGSEDSRALLFDLQDQYTYLNDRNFPDDIEKRRTQLPRYSLGGHQKKVQNIGWSATGKHFMTMDEGGVRVWEEPRQRKAWQLNEHDELPVEPANDLGLAYEKVKVFEMGESDAAMSCIDSISISPRQRAESVGSSPQKGRGAKRAMVPTSPFKIIGSPGVLSRSPRAKMCKLSSSPSSSGLLPLQALPDNEQGYRTPRRQIKKKTNPFYYEHPTEHLPNFVYDQFCKKMMGKEDDDDEIQKSLSKTSRKRLEDWWQGRHTENLTTAIRRRLPSVSEFGESACSKVISEEERNALRSPRKMVLKTLTPTPSEAATPTGTPVTSSSYLTPSTRSARRTIQATPSKPAGHRPTSRNLLHYFKK